MNFMEELEEEIGERVHAAIRSENARIRWAAYGWLALLGSFVFALRTLHGSGNFGMFVADMKYACCTNRTFFGEAP